MLPSIKQDIANIWRYRGTTRVRFLQLIPGQSRVGYIGWQGHGNLGDDVMFTAAQRLLRGARVLGFENRNVEEALSPIRLGGKAYFTSMVLGGGTLIGPTWQTIGEQACELGVPVWSLGTGVGSSGWGQAANVQLEAWRTILARFTHVGVRGPRSKQRLAEIGVHNARIVGDLALSLTRNTVTTPAGPRRLAFNFSLGRTGDDQPAALIGIQRLLADLVAHDWQIVPFAMNEADVLPIGMALRRLGLRVPVIYRPRTARDVIDLIAPCTMTIGVRLHATILSCCAGVPPLMLGYREKCLDFMESMGLSAWHLDLGRADADSVVSAGVSLATAADAMRPAILDRARYWRETLRRYVEEVREHLRR